ncbi:hypothetical protein FGIG_10296 [Fasciola gigantica]|uniref:Uncharacterized protein n=1 Tax=Fasciola gigantica TaxID=46835 RepID=A0A504YX47_FASGI|nr:hypothetical protein FGIG_10296 [Fasciola gigantica]
MHHASMIFFPAQALSAYPSDMAQDILLTGHTIFIRCDLTEAVDAVFPLRLLLFPFFCLSVHPLTESWFLANHRSSSDFVVE